MKTKFNLIVIKLVLIFFAILCFVQEIHADIDYEVVSLSHVDFYDSESGSYLGRVSKGSDGHWRYFPDRYLRDERQNNFNIRHNFNQPNYPTMSHGSFSGGRGNTNYRSQSEFEDEQRKERTHNLAMSIIHRNNAERHQRQEQEREARSRRSEAERQLHQS